MLINLGEDSRDRSRDGQHRIHSNSLSGSEADTMGSEGPDVLVSSMLSSVGGLWRLQCRNTGKAGPMGPRRPGHAVLKPHLWGRVRTWLSIAQRFTL